jgi:hypothetical protein
MKDEDGPTPLSRAAVEGPEPLVRLLLGTEVDLDTKDNDGRTLLSRASAAGEETVVKVLLATGKVDVDTKDKDGRTPLSRAAAAGKAAVVKLLLATGKVDVNTRDNDGRTPLSIAVQISGMEVVKLLLATGKIDPDTKDKHGLTPLSIVVQQIRDLWPRILERVQKQGNYALQDYQMQLMLREQQNKKRLMMARQEQYSLTQPLHQTLSNKDTHEEVAHEGVAHEEVTHKKVTHEEGIYEEAKAIINLLLATGIVDPDAKGEDGQTPLSIAAEAGAETVVRLLSATGKAQESWPLRTEECAPERWERFGCPHQDCVGEHGELARFFTRRADLQRHLSTTHNPQYFDCPKARCGRKGVNGFSRRDHLTEHLRGYHKEEILKRRY